MFILKFRFRGLGCGGQNRRDKDNSFPANKITFPKKKFSTMPPNGC
jgi:hypothetical protein